MTADTDAILRARLGRLARAIPVRTENQLRPVVALTPRYRGGSGLGALTAVAIVLALVLAAVYASGGAKSTSVVDSTSDALFRLTVEATKDHYTPQEPIEVSATLEYVGPERSIDVHSYPDLVGFGVEQIDGTLRADPAYRSSCVMHSFVRGQSVRYPFVKSGGLNPDAPDADFMRSYLNITNDRPDPVLRLPRGTWRIFAEVGYAEGSCGDTNHELDAGITVVVAGPEASFQRP